MPKKKESKVKKVVNKVTRKRRTKAQKEADERNELIRHLDTEGRSTIEIANITGLHKDEVERIIRS